MAGATDDCETEAMASERSMAEWIKRKLNEIGASSSIKESAGTAVVQFQLPNGHRYIASIVMLS